MFDVSLNLRAVHKARGRKIATNLEVGIVSRYGRFGSHDAYEGTMGRILGGGCNGDKLEAGIRREV
ncbi:MAG TPA: hypothetical protein PK156_35245 [Polyangium sp.]|nr:hypothetical protein [Polyangium sp.]